MFFINKWLNYLLSRPLPLIVHSLIIDEDFIRQDFSFSC
ncbi:hypothetical protein KKC1_14430 [Calderihabitans maritimus]|uniref:Uncharacterized protein n=1 Tax=Calderihabitans maritimus TaxID=1246530 RepID=A0A1Z5HSF5_9FIRM|nr:hypothetical protein KKC1_14430 [Calderihabitans maritimus]